MQARVGQPGIEVHGLLLVRASSPARAKGMAEHVLTVLRGRRGIGSGLILRRGRVATAAVMSQTGRGRSWLTASELLPLLGWPLGIKLVEGVTVGAAVGSACRVMSRAMASGSSWDATPTASGPSR